MQVTVRYFAIVRETIGRSEETVSVSPGETTTDLLARLTAATPSLTPLLRSIMVMVNQEYVRADHPLHDGDELALIPPVSGGENGSRYFRVQADFIDAREVEGRVASPGMGAIVTFTGTVRDQARGRTVASLEYEAYAPAAEKMLRQIGDEISANWAIDRVAIVHRVGVLTVGEASVVIAVAAPHRADAFAACHYAIDRIKQIVPIWKKELYADGAAWIGSESEYQRDADKVFDLIFRS